MQIKDYVKPELLVVAVVLYFIGMWLKQSETVKDKYIPLINGLIGVAICAIYVFATCACGSGQDIALAVFTALTQGVLVAGLSTYVNQIFRKRRVEGGDPTISRGSSGRGCRCGIATIGENRRKPIE
jgi:hypothetical protein